LSTAARLSAVVLAVVAGLAPAPAARGYDNDHNSGLHWLRKCTSPEPGGQIECAIYVKALVDYDELRSRTLAQKRYICPAKDATIGQTFKAVLKYLRELPAHELRQPFVQLAHQGLAAAFPCPAATESGAGGDAPPPK
jgi:hypothetical protein